MILEQKSLIKLRDQQSSDGFQGLVRQQSVVPHRTTIIQINSGFGKNLENGEKRLQCFSN